MKGERKMNLSLFKVSFWEDDELVDKMGIVMGNTLSDAVKNLEDYFGNIEEISYLSLIGNSMVYELDDSNYEFFSNIKDNFIW